MDSERLNIARCLLRIWRLFHRKPQTRHLVDHQMLARFALVAEEIAVGGVDVGNYAEFTQSVLDDGCPFLERLVHRDES